MSREFDIVIFGATSYTAKLCLKYLIDTYGPSGKKVKYALAGRDRSRIEKVITELNLPTDTPIRECTLDFLKLSALARETNTIINFVGPFSAYGEPVVKACIEENTHYVDSSGEIDWCHYLSSNYHHKAAEQGVKIMPCMGFDYTGFDMGLAILHHATPGVWRGSHVVATCESNTEGASHGTLSTILKAIEEGPMAPLAPNVEQTKNNNRFLIPKTAHGRTVVSSLMGPGAASYLEWLNTVFLHGRWSNGDGSGAAMDIVIGEEAHTWFEVITRTLRVLYIYLFVSVLVVLPISMRKRLLPPSGGGCNIPEDAFLRQTFRFYKSGEEDSKTTVEMKYDQGECYVFTGVACLESALTVALGADNQKNQKMMLPTNFPAVGGVGSGSMLLGDAYRRRLETAGVHFEVIKSD